MKKFLLKLGGFVVAFFVALGLIFAFWRDSREVIRDIGWRWVLAVALLVAFAVALRHWWEELQEWRRQWRRIMGLEGRKLEAAAKEMIRSAQKITFIGHLDGTIGEALRDRAATKFQSIVIRNVDPEFYTKLPDLAEDLGLLDAKYDAFESRFRLSGDLVDVLAVSSSRDRVRLLLRWRDPGTGSGVVWRGVQLNRVPWPEEGLASTGPIVSCDNPDGLQGQHLTVTAAALADYCSKIRGGNVGDEEGWSMPVLPALDTVLAVMRAQNLRWFDEVARFLIKPATKTDEVCITWRIGASSSVDATQFETWLTALKDSNVHVRRYLFVDAKRLHDDVQYSNVVTEIDKKYFSGDGRVGKASYQVLYVPTDALDSVGIPQGDFGLFKVGKKLWAHGSLQSGDHIERAWFCRTSKMLTKYESFFTRLAAGPSFDDLQSLRKARGV